MQSGFLSSPDWTAWPERVGLLDRVPGHAPQPGGPRPRRAAAVAHEVESLADEPPRHDPRGTCSQTHARHQSFTAVLARLGSARVRCRLTKSSARSQARQHPTLSVQLTPNALFHKASSRRDRLETLRKESGRLSVYSRIAVSAGRASGREVNPSIREFTWQSAGTWSGLRIQLGCQLNEAIPNARRQGGIVRINRLIPEVRQL